MPRVPEYVSQQKVPGTAPFQQASPAAFGASVAHLVQQGAQEIESAANLAQRHLQYIEQEKEQTRRNIAAEGGLNTFLEESYREDNALKRGIGQEPATSVDYIPRLKTKTDEIRKNVVENISKVHGQEVGTLLDSRIQHAIRLRQDNVAKYADQLYVSETRSGLRSNGDQALRLFVAEPDPVAAGVILETHRAFIRSTEGSLGADGVEKELQRFDQKALYERGSVMISTPAGREQFMEDVSMGRYNELDPEKLRILQARVKTEEEREMTKAAKKDTTVAYAQDGLMLEIGQMITQRKLTEASARLDLAVERRELKANQVEHLRDRITRPVAEPASDPDIRRAVLTDSETMNPKHTLADIQNLMDKHAKGLPGLNSVDGLRAMQQIRSTNTTFAHRAEDQRRVRISKDHAQAEQELRSFFGVREDMFSNIRRDDPIQRMHTQVLEELRRRSLHFDGAEEPLFVKDDILRRIGPDMPSNMRLTDTELKTLYPGFRDLEKAVLNGSVSKDQYESHMKFRLQGGFIPEAPKQPTAPKATPKAPEPAPQTPAAPTPQAPPAAPGRKRYVPE